MSTQNQDRSRIKNSRKRQAGLAITQDKIQLIGEIKIHKLYQLYISIISNHHAKAVLKGIDSTGESIENIGNIQHSVIKIMYWDEEMVAWDVLFAGIVSKLTFKRVDRNRIPFVEIELASGTILLDREKRSCSFQNIANSYQQIVSQVLDKTKEAMYVDTIDEQSIGTPVIQYHETDWEFLCRLASHVGSVLYPDVTTEYPRFCFGFPEGKVIVELESDEYEAGICEEYLDIEEPSGWFVYYELKLQKNYEIGTKILFHHKLFQIVRKQVYLEKGQLVFHYRLRMAETIVVTKMYNNIFTGRTLSGTVLSVSGETIKLHLDIDESQKESEAYPYAWIPETGNIMYLMPKVGTKVSLYFSGADERTAKAINCIRENGSTAFGTSDPSKRGLTTEHGKVLFLDPEKMGVKGESNALILADENGLSIESNHTIHISSEKKVKLKGNRLTLTTPKEIQIRRG